MHERRSTRHENHAALTVSRALMPEEGEAFSSGTSIPGKAPHHAVPPTAVYWQR